MAKDRISDDEHEIYRHGGTLGMESMINLMTSPLDAPDFRQRHLVAKVGVSAAMARVGLLRVQNTADALELRRYEVDRSSAGRRLEEKPDENR